MVRDKTASINIFSTMVKHPISVVFILLLLLPSLSFLLNKYSMLTHGRVKYLYRNFEYHGSIIIMIIFLLNNI